MNCIEIFAERQKEVKDNLALWCPGQEKMSFGELYSLAARIQIELLKQGLRPEDPVLVFEGLSPRLYATILALLSTGATILFVEPWMPLKKIEHVIQTAKPRFFLAGVVGKLWGLRVPAIRKIPNWISVNSLAKATKTGELKIESVPGEVPGIITFTTGTTGKPKGVVRHQSYLLEQYRVFSKSLSINDHSGPDLCIFANFALANLAAGRGSLIIPSGWKKKHLKQLDHFSAKEKPETMTSGPAFLMRLMELGVARDLKSIHIGGALTDCAIFEKGFAHWPKTHWMHLYGSSEAEPVALADAEEAVRKSREKGLFQTLYLGKPISEVEARVEDKGLWITGPHVCPKYFANEDENRIHKHTDEKGRVWHAMGDRIEEDSSGWWYSGRAQQSRADFTLEQNIYSHLQSSNAFLHRDKDKLIVYGKNLEKRKGELLKAFPSLTDCFSAPIVRDRRHRARIDRVESRKRAK